MAIFLHDPMRILTAEQRAQLRAIGLASADQLADRVLADHEFLEQFGPEMQRRIVIITARVTAPKARSLLQAPYRAHALDFLLLAALLLSGVAISRDLHVLKIQEVPGVIVKRPGGLLPFEVIVPTDIALAKPNPSESGTTSDFEGRYSPVYIANGAPISKEKLSKGIRLSAELNDRIILRLKTQSTNIFSGVAPPYRAALLVAPHERGTSALFLNDVFVLDLQTDGDGFDAVLALPSSDESILGAFMARSDFVLIAHQP